MAWLLLLRAVLVGAALPLRTAADARLPWWPCIGGASRLVSLRGLAPVVLVRRFECPVWASEQQFQEWDLFRSPLNA